MGFFMRCSLCNVCIYGESGQVCSCKDCMHVQGVACTLQQQYCLLVPDQTGRTTMALVHDGCVTCNLHTICVTQCMLRAPSIISTAERTKRNNLGSDKLSDNVSNFAPSVLRLATADRHVVAGVRRHKKTLPEHLCVPTCCTLCRTRACSPAWCISLIYTNGLYAYVLL
jgi:hypothetical protein